MAKAHLGLGNLHLEAAYAPTLPEDEPDTFDSGVVGEIVAPIFD